MTKETTVRLFQEMADHTLARCGPPHCRCVPETRCCSPEYCHMAIDYAATKGIELARTSHPVLPLMGPTGCVAPPHLRPLCTLHQCSVNSFGGIKGDNDWNLKYFNLRSKIEESYE